MATWIKRLWQSFQSWCAENRRAHEQAPDRPCCSRPPQIPGKQDKY